MLILKNFIIWVVNMFDFKTVISIENTAWLYLSCYVGGFVSQIIKNYKIRSTKGLGDLYLLSYLAGYIAIVYYVFALNFLLPYKVIFPIGLLLILIIIIQRAYFDGVLFKKWFFISVTFILSIAVCIIPFFHIFTKILGDIAGWLAVVFLSVNQIFQMAKIFRSRSIEGFSFTFITILAIGVFFELLVAFLKELPIQTKFLVFRGLLVYAIFCLQFLFYRRGLKY